jgi:hypothetical protein
MSLEKVLEEQIQRAVAEGKFDNLRGAGKTLNLDDYLATPEEVRVGYTLLKDNNFVSPEVELLNEIGALKEKIKNCPDEAQKKILTKNLNEKSIALTMILERNKRTNKS